MDGFIVNLQPLVWMYNQPLSNPFGALIFSWFALVIRRKRESKGLLETRKNWIIYELFSSREKFEDFSKKIYNSLRGFNYCQNSFFGVQHGLKKVFLFRWNLCLEWLLITTGAYFIIKTELDEYLEIRDCSDKLIYSWLMVITIRHVTCYMLQ